MNCTKLYTATSFYKNILNYSKHIAQNANPTKHE